MKLRGLVLILVVPLLLAGGCTTSVQRGRRTVIVTGEMKQWHNVTLTFAGPHADEAGDINPFLDARLEVTFARYGKKYIVPGYYAADGNAGQTGATGGNQWRVHFLPPEPGRWTYTVSFRIGTEVAIDSNAPTIDRAREHDGSRLALRRAALDGVTGTITVGPTDKTGRDFRGQGLLRYTGQRYLQFAHTGTHFLKGGADSPENFLGYADFDQTYDSAELKRSGEAAGEKFIHQYQPHVEDWRPGDPTWQNDKGKGIIGALNYLAAKGMNSVYFLTYNIDGGDGQDVWPWTSPGERLRFDCSKLDQWEIVFSHMDKLGLAMHVVTQETENDQALDGGEGTPNAKQSVGDPVLGRQRKLYYRELIARFAHHPALVWNLGEENTNTNEQRKAFAKYLHDLDPYDHPVVCHTYPGKYDEVYGPLLGYEFFEGPSLQTNDTHRQTMKWLNLSAQARRQWFVCLDEIGPSHTGVKPDNDDYWHDDVRRQHLWGNLMAGGAGVEWYFGYNFPNNDLNCENWRTRDHLWDLTRYALSFFHDRLPYWKMSHHDELTSTPDDYCFACPGQVYAVYLPFGGTTNLDVEGTTATFQIRWFNPREGGLLQMGTIASATGPGNINLGQPPEDTDKDWVALVEGPEQ